MSHNKVIINLDATALGKSACILNLIRTVVGDPSQPTIGGYREKVLSINIVYGIAFHAFIDTMYKTGGHYPTARKKAEHLLASIPTIPDKKKAWMSDPRHLIAVCFNVWTNFIEQDETFDVLSCPVKCVKCGGKGVIETLQPEGVHQEHCTICCGSGTVTGPATEINFSLPYYEDDYIIVNLCGTLDTLGKIKNGCYLIRDWKTTSSWDNKGYFKQYELSRQLRMYVLACKIMTERYSDSLLGQIGATRMGTRIDAIFLSSNPNEVEVNSSDVFQYDEADIQDFRKLLDAKIQEISSAIRNNYFPKQGILNGSCEQKFHKCSFWDVCKSKGHVPELLLNRDFVRKVWDPLSFNE